MWGTFLFLRRPTDPEYIKRVVSTYGDVFLSRANSVNFTTLPPVSVLNDAKRSKSPVHEV